MLMAAHFLFGNGIITVEKGGGHMLGRNGKLLTLVIVTVAVVGGTTQFLSSKENEYERVYWDRGDARKIIKRAHVTDHGSFGELFAATATFGASPRTHGIWLTDDVCWALAVFVQHEERRTDEEKEAIYKDCRALASEYYTIYVSAQIFAGGLTYPDVTDTHRVGQIFLQSRKNKDKFVRPARIDTPPDYFMHLKIVSTATKRADLDIDRDILIRFPRNEELLRGQKDIDLELRQGDNKQRLKFSLKKLRANKGRLDNL